MSTPRAPVPAQIFLSVLGADWDAFWPGALDDLADFFGPVDYDSGPLPFDHTTYYDGELGSPINRRILGFLPLLAQDELADAKLATNAVEKKYTRSGKRTCNLDPGIITQERLVLATGKNFTHRVYLGKKIFADLTLIFQRGAWRSMPWTFQDYASPVVQDHLTNLRKLHKQKAFALEPTNLQGTLCPKA